jgi:hypothetical protein
VKVSIIKQQVMKMYGDVEGELHAFLTLALNAG